MEIKFLNQPKDVKLIDILTEKLRDTSFSRVWIIAGFAKDSAMDYILEDVLKARENGTQIECVFGLDKKNTSKDMLLKFLNCGCNIRYHLNDDGAKLESRLYAFESTEGDSYVYITGGKFSENGISNNLTLIEEIKYSKDEKIEFSKVRAAIENGISKEEFDVLTEDKLKELASTGDIMARITERKIPKISELYSSNAGEETENATKEYDEGASTDFKELLQKDLDIDIDMGEESVKVQDSLGEEVEHKLKNTNEEKPEETVVSKMILGNDKPLNYDKMSTLIIYLSKSEEGNNDIKIPSAITSNMFKFLNYPDAFHAEEDEKGNLNETQKITLEIFENGEGDTFIDDDAKIIQSTKNTTIMSVKLSKIDIQDGDIMRLIKVSDGNFRCEIIKQNTNEHSIWEGFCTSTTKGSSKKFGIA